MENQQTRQILREFISRFVRARTFTDADDIVATRAVNSLFMMQLVLFIEKQFDLKIENEDLELRNFSSIDAMVGFIERKRGVACVGSEM